MFVGFVFNFWAGENASLVPLIHQSPFSRRKRDKPCYFLEDKVANLLRQTGIEPGVSRPLAPCPAATF